MLRAFLMTGVIIIAVAFRVFSSFFFIVSGVHLAPGHGRFGRRVRISAVRRIPGRVFAYRFHGPPYGSSDDDYTVRGRVHLLLYIV